MTGWLAAFEAMRLIEMREQLLHVVRQPTASEIDSARNES
jgi:hypothetical protein